MPVASAIAGIGGSLASGFIGSSAAERAAQAQTAASTSALNQSNQGLNNSLGTLGQIYSTDQNALAPYQSTGVGALGQLPGAVLSGAPDANAVLAQDPGYQFRLDQGNLALQRMEAAGGNTGSGGALKDAAAYGQNLASSEYGNAFNRLMQANQQRYGQLLGLADLGQNANSQLINAGANYGGLQNSAQMNTANLNAQLLTGMGNAQASGYIGKANAWSNAISGIGNALGSGGLSGIFGNKSARAQQALNGAQNASLAGLSAAPYGYSLGSLGSFAPGTGDLYAGQTDILGNMGYFG